MSAVTVDDRVFQKLKHKLEQGDSGVKVGILGGHGAQDSNGKITYAQVAAIQEFGLGVPERSFIRRTLHEKHHQLIRVQAALAKELVTTHISKKTALEKLGLWASAEIKKTITEGEGIPPPNAPATIARKGSSRTLVDTGGLVNRITHEVVPEGSAGGH